MYKRILAIGDIHGEYDKLVDLYGKIEFNPAEDLLVFLGDYIDHGPEPIEVLEWLMERRGEPNIVMLRGNHEQMMLDYYRNKETQKTMGGPFVPDDVGGDWLVNGGSKTEQALDDFMLMYDSISAEEKKEEFLRFIAGLPLHHRVEVGDRTWFFCHAGVNPGLPLEKQKPACLLEIRREFFGIDPATGRPYYRGAPVVVAGHSLVRKARKQLRMEITDLPVIRDNMILLDTGSGKKGPLTCVDVLSGRVWQSYGTK